MRRERRLGLLRRLAGRFEQGLQVVLEVAVVGEAGLGIEIDANLDVGILDLQRLGEAGQRARLERSRARSLRDSRNRA